VKADGDFLVLHPSAKHDPDGAKLAAALRASQALDQARALRQRLVYVLAAAGLPLWLALARGGAGAGSWRSFALASWAVAFLGFVGALVDERRCYKKRAFWVHALEVEHQRGSGPP
jgi:hypothetical protein